MKTIEIDCETCGFVGPVVLIQYRIDDGPIILYHVWDHPVGETLDLLEMFLENHLVIYNATYEGFHLNKLYNTFRLLEESNQQPTKNDVWEAEHYAWEGPCLKPAKVSDLFLLILEHGLQFLNNRKPINIYGVPNDTVPWIKERLEEYTKSLCPLLFRTKKPGERVSVKRNKNNKYLSDMELSFGGQKGPYKKMKMVLGWLLGVPMIEFDIPNEQQPEEKIYRPWGGTWRDKIFYHVKWWKNEGQSYAIQDILSLQILTQWLAGTTKCHAQPDRIWDINTTHMNSDLAWGVGASRQRGFPIDNDLIAELVIETRTLEKVPTSPAQSLRYLHEVCTPEQKIAIQNTNGYLLDELILMYPESPLAFRCNAIQECRSKDKKLDLLLKLQEVGRFHPDFSVATTFSNRMSGGSGKENRGGGSINPQGIMSDPRVRAVFILHSKTLTETLSGGDFSQQELTVLDAILGPSVLRDLIVQGKKIHRFLCSFAYDIPENEVDESSIEYSRSKNGVFAFVYGAEIPRLAKTVGVSEDKVARAFDQLLDMVPELGKLKERLAEDFLSMYQPQEGGKVFWREPKPFIESLFGFRRYFDIENGLTKFLFGLANSARGTDFGKGVVVRNRKRGDQSYPSAASTALFAAAFSIQGRNLRAAGNHIIQSPGANITKALQAIIWALQPAGINEWHVQPINIHDEIITPTLIPQQVTAVVEYTISELRTKIPNLKIKWKESIPNWAGVK